MTQTIEAVYEKGVFRPKKPLSMKDGQEVELTIANLWPPAGRRVEDAEFTALASEEALGRIWNDAVEDEAWAHL